MSHNGPHSKHNCRWSMNEPSACSVEKSHSSRMKAMSESSCGAAGGNRVNARWIRAIAASLQNTPIESLSLRIIRTSLLSTVAKIERSMFNVSDDATTTSAAWSLGPLNAIRAFRKRSHSPARKGVEVLESDFLSEVVLLLRIAVRPMATTTLAIVIRNLIAISEASKNVGIMIALNPEWLKPSPHDPSDHGHGSTKLEPRPCSYASNVTDF